MKKSLVLLLLVFVVTFSSAQTHRFLYEFSYKNDSLSEKIKKTNVVLDINDKDVQYYDFYAIEMDSLNSVDPNSVYTSSSSFANLKRSLSSTNNKNYYLIADNYFYFETSDKILWKISSETKEKDKMKLQKATSDFGGRTWEAWFDKDIPFSEGPYKFNGLPGLIVEVQDTKGNFKFELTKIEKPNNANPIIVENVFRKKPLKIDLKKYKNILIGYYNDPYSHFRNMKPGTWSIGIDENNIINTIEGLNKITRDEQESIRKNYNPIELDKAVLYEK